jgi:flagellum-specific peptidoglycan hydrolase FlgJ
MMKNLRLAFVTGILFFVSPAIAQQADPTILQYISTYRELAIREMQRTGVPAAIKLAQGILETEAGQSDLVQRSNNHFGIKCKSWWTGEKVYHDDDERGECFRKYGSAEDSYRDHSDYLKSQPRYAFLFTLDPEDYKGWAYGLKKAGYATNPKYPQIIIKFIETYSLEDYTLVALGKKTLPPDLAANTNKKNQTDQPVFLDDISTDGAKPTNSNNAAASNSESAPDKVNYPQGEFRINDTKVVYAKSGTSLLDLAEEYDVRLKWLLDFNELKKGSEVLNNDQLIFLQRKRRQGGTEFHIVKQGEDLYNISQQEGMRLEYLLKYNQLAIGMQPAPGEKLYLQDEAPERPRLVMREEKPVMVLENEDKEAASASESTDINTEVQKHIVQSKETLYSIARKYEVSKDQLIEWNKLRGEDLKIGQELIIYKNR